MNREDTSNGVLASQGHMRRIAAMIVACLSFALSSGLSAQDAELPLKTKEGSTFKLYGTVGVDAMYDDSRGNDTQIYQWTRSEDKEAPASIRAERNKEDFTMHSRLTRLGFDFMGPTLTDLYDGKISGKLEVDFYLFPASESRAEFRMRHSYLKVQWGATELLAGQTADLISPLFPAINYDIVMWNAGNLGDRRAQIRLTHKMNAGPIVLTPAVAAALGNAVDGGDTTNATGGNPLANEASGVPMVQGRLGVGYAFSEAWRGIDIGFWAHKSSEEYSTAFANGDVHLTSYSVGCDYTLPIWEKKLYLTGEFWAGSNLDDVRGGIGQGVDAGGDEVRAKGGFVQMTCENALASWHSIRLGVSMDDPESRDLADAGRNQNRVLYVQNQADFNKAFRIGIEYMNWHTEFKGFDGGTNNRVKVYFNYSF